MAPWDLFCFAYGIPVIILLVIRIIVAFWITADAKTHGIDPLMYAIIGFILGLIGLVVYYVFKEDVYKKRARQMYGYNYPPPYYGNPYPYPNQPAYGGQPYLSRPEYRRGLDPDVVCDGCGHIVKNIPVGGVLFCENCGKQVRTMR